MTTVSRLCYKYLSWIINVRSIIIIMHGDEMKVADSVQHLLVGQVENKGNQYMITKYYRFLFFKINT